MYHSIVIGGGPAGMSAAIYLARKKLEVLLLTDEFGGQAAKSSEIENYLGYTKISGPELLSKFMEHLEAVKVESMSGQNIESIKKIDGGYEVKSSGEVYQARTILVASGKMPRRLGITGEEKFIGKGISYCAICDGPLFGGKNVAVIGGGNSALDAAIEMEKYASKVYLLNLNKEFLGDEVRKDHVQASEKIEVISQVETVEFAGEQFLNVLKYKDLKTGEVKEIECSGAFVEIGWTPATEFIKDLVELNDIKEIKINGSNETSAEGIFSAGDVTDIQEKQIIIAAGEGAKASLNVWKYLVTNKLLN